MEEGEGGMLGAVLCSMVFSWCGEGEEEVMGMVISSDILTAAASLA